MTILLTVLGVLLMTAVPYIFGCSNGAILVSKYILRNDIRNHGSGNAGLTNFTRVFGGKLAVLVILADVLKAVFALLAGALGAKLMNLAGLDWMTVLRAKYVAGLCCELGHMFPVTFGFRGGKGILSGGIISIMIDWRLALVVWGSFLLLTALTRYVSVGSISTGVWYAVMACLLFRDLFIAPVAIVTGFLVVFQHRSNIGRLIHGNENRLSFHKKESREDKP